MTRIRDRPWRRIIRRDTTTEEKSSIRGRTYSWRATLVHILTLSCGHTQKRRGHGNHPKHKTVCKRCEAGEAPIEGTVEAGVFEDIPGQPRDPVARAMIANAVEQARKAPS